MTMCIPAGVHTKLQSFGGTMKSKKIGVVGAVVASVIAASTLVAPAAQAEPKVITMWVSLDVASVYQNWARTFNRTHSSIILNVIGKNGFSGKDLLPTVADADAPDLMMLNHDVVGPLKAQGFLVPVTLPNAKQFSAGDQTAFKLKGANYGVPVNFQNTAFFTNLNLVHKAPKTMAEVETLSKAFLKKHPKSKFTIAVPAETYHMYPFFSGMGGYVFGGTSGNWNVHDVGVANKKFIKNAPLIDRWYQEKIFNANASGDNALAAFTSNQAPFMVTGPWNIDKIRLKHVNYQISNFPTVVKGINPVPFITVVGIGMTKWAGPDKHNTKLTANTVLADLASAKVQLTLAQGALASPANTVARAKFRDADTQAFTAASKGGVYMPNILEMGGVWTPLSNAWSQVKSNKFAANRFKTAYSTITEMINK